MIDVHEILRTHDEQKAARADQMPTEQDCLRVMMQAHLRLKELGWNDAVYCPKDGSTFKAIEPGSSGTHFCQYTGEWPTGHWWIQDENDLWPSRPSLYRPLNPDEKKP